MALESSGIGCIVQLGDTCDARLLLAVGLGIILGILGGLLGHNLVHESELGHNLLEEILRKLARNLGSENIFCLRTEGWILNGACHEYSERLLDERRLHLDFFLSFQIHQYMRNHLGRDIINMLTRPRPNSVYKGYAEHTVERRIRHCQLEPFGRICGGRCCFWEIPYCVKLEAPEFDGCVAPHDPNTTPDSHRKVIYPPFYKSKHIPRD